MIKYKIDNKSYKTNTVDKTDFMKINLSFQCINKVPDAATKIPEPIN